MKVTVPAGAAPNKMLQAASPTGERVAFFPPAGAGGRDVYLPLDDATAGPAPPPVAAPIPAPGGQLTWSEADAATVAPPAPTQPSAAPPQPQPAATAAPGMIEIQVPEGAVPGATLEFQLDDGRTLDVTVPEGARAGDRLQVPTDAADAPPPPPAVPRQTGTAESIEIQVPEGAVPGSTLEFTLDDGRTIDITVPEGARAGDRLEVPVPPLSPSAGPDGDAADWDEGPDDLDEIEEME